MKAESQPLPLLAAAPVMGALPALRSQDRPTPCVVVVQSLNGSHGGTVPNLSGRHWLPITPARPSRSAGQGLAQHHPLRVRLSDDRLGDVLDTGHCIVATRVGLSDRTPDPHAQGMADLPSPIRISSPLSGTRQNAAWSRSADAWLACSRK